MPIHSHGQTTDGIIIGDVYFYDVIYETAGHADPRGSSSWLDARLVLPIVLILDHVSAYVNPRERGIL